MKKNILITGIPKSGKSTLLKNVITAYANKVGFVTHEIRDKGERVGFEIETHEGEKSMLAHTRFKTKQQVSRYFVNTENLDAIIPKVKEFDAKDLLYIDEIAEMQLYSEKFKELVTTYFGSPNICIATLSRIFEDEFIKEIKTRNDVIFIELSKDDRETKQIYMTKLLGKIAKAQRYASEPERFSIEGDRVTMRTDHGTKSLEKKDNMWLCDCDFFKQNNICSHVIALEEVLS